MDFLSLLIFGVLTGSAAHALDIPTLALFALVFFPDAALVVFFLYMRRYVDRRDVVVAQSVMHLKHRMDKSESKFVDALSRIADRITKEKV